MIRKLSAALLVAFVALAQTSAPALAATPKGQQTPEEVKIRINRAGLGEKARVTVWLRDGRKVKGYVAERRDTEFVIRDRKTDSPTIIAFGDVTKVDINRGHSTARNIAIGAAVGVGTMFTALAILIAVVDD